MTFRRYLILAIVTLTSALGDTFLAHGMQQLGPVSVHHLGSLIVALKIPWILAGIFLLIGFFASYLTALSWADLTYVLPATSMAYVVVALLSKFWLHESISLSRWLGIFCIVAGVGFVTRGPALTEPAEDTSERSVTGDGLGGASHQDGLHQDALHRETIAAPEVCAQGKHA